MPASASINVGSPRAVIVTGPEAISAIGCVSGAVVASYPAIGGAEAMVSPSGESSLQETAGLTVTPDVSASAQSTAVYSCCAHSPSDVFLKQTGANKLATSGDIGQRVTVAVLDTGIDGALPDFAGRLIGGVDLTGAGLPFVDAYGHGTFVAGLIAGNGASSAGKYSGEAPGANLVSIKVAGATGTTDLATLIAGVQWAINNQQQYGIRVLNISFGFVPESSTFSNPLDQAIEAAWNAGIAVVTSAGNAGPFNGTILSPGDDPLAITVGALDDMANAGISNDEMTDFSSVGPTNPDGWIKPDLVTSGRSIISLADPGSTICNAFPSALIGLANFVGSGTSFSAAITSGAAALVIADNPSLTPNQVKAQLLGTTNPGPVGDPFVDGHGDLNVQAAATGISLGYNQSLNGLSPSGNGATVSLANDGPADTWNPSLWTGASWNGALWNGAWWNGSNWSGASWNGFTFNGASWNGASWNGASWNGASWNGASWNGASWNGSSWNGSSWNGASWNGASWN